jgi:hypothetical protein
MFIILNYFISFLFVKLLFSLVVSSRGGNFPFNFMNYLFVALIRPWLLALERRSVFRKIYESSEFIKLFFLCFRSENRLKEIERREAARAEEHRVGAGMRLLIAPGKTKDGQSIIEKVNYQLARKF